MISDRKQPSVAFWITVALVVVLAGYPLSFGPACWITSRAKLSGKWVTIPYRPVIWLWETGPEPVGDLIVWYSELGAPGDSGWTQHIPWPENTNEVERGPL